MFRVIICEATYIKVRKFKFDLIRLEHGFSYVVCKIQEFYLSLNSLLYNEICQWGHLGAMLPSAIKPDKKACQHVKWLLNRGGKNGKKTVAASLLKKKGYHIHTFTHEPYLHTNTLTHMRVNTQQNDCKNAKSTSGMLHLEFFLSLLVLLLRDLNLFP